MAVSLSKRCASLLQSEIRNMSIECERLGGVNLSQGVCDMPPPPVVQRGAAEAIEAGLNHYTRYDGIPELREAIAAKMSSFNGLECDPETEITVSSGATGSFYCACLALLNPADEVILFEPVYGYHVNTLLAVDAVPKFVKLRGPEFQFDPDELEAAVTKRTRAILINTPANPSGKVFDRAELEVLAEFADRHDLIVFTDEIYEYIVYDGRRHVSPATLESLRPRCVTISGYSKTFSITGWRIGYSVAPPEWARMIGYMNDLVYVCAPAPLQMGVARGIRDLAPSYYTEICADFAKKRTQICETLEQVGLPPTWPQGAYYVLADISRLPGDTSKERAMHLLREGGVATVPGEAFYERADDGAHLTRFCYAKSDPDLDEACRRLRAL